MTASGTLRAWLAVHRWSSLVSTLFLLVLCVSGLPLVFHAEIDEAFGFLPRSSASGPPQPLTAVVRAGEAARKGEVVQFLVWEPDKPGIVSLSMAKSATIEPSGNDTLYVDAVTARVIEPRGPMEFIKTLHTQLFLGEFGPLGLGCVAVLFLVAIVSGMVVYGPFMRQLAFGTIRTVRARRTRWLDLHNVYGVAIAGWMIVVATTGLVNTWGNFVLEFWQATTLQALAAPYQSSPLPVQGVTPDYAAARARETFPAMTPYFLSYPGSMLTTRRHYAVFMRGDTPLRARLVQPVLVDAVTGTIAATPALPALVKAALLAEPLHFGDYGGWPLKLLWAILDLLTIHVLVTGLCLWWSKQGKSDAVLQRAESVSR